MCAPDVSPHPWATQITPCPMHPVSRVDRLLPEMLNVSRTAWYSCCSHSMRAVGQAEVLKDHVANTSNKICVSGRPSTGSGPGEKKFSAPPPPPATARANRLKIFTINQKYCQLQGDLGWT